jgi:hypothetical protein
MVTPDEGPVLSASSGNDPGGPKEADGPTEEAHSPPEETCYGPIGFRRYAKDDGRALILFTWEESPQAGPVQDRPARE